MKYSSIYLQKLIKIALDEDMGSQDITTFNLVDPEQSARGIFMAKSPGVLAGIDIAGTVFKHLDPQTAYTKCREDGDNIGEGDIIAEVKGKTAVLLTGERVALNFIQRLSGIATKTRSMADSIKYYKAEIVDTRKTTPGLRVLEKYAVRVGGGRNHRFGLYDGVMIKDNHIKAAGSIQKAVSTLRRQVPHTLKIEVEVENLEQLQEALEAGADIIMLDNMNTDNMRKAVEIAAGKVLLEASGGIDENNLTDAARTGVDFISVGALTHSAAHLDISFKLIEVY